MKLKLITCFAVLVFASVGIVGLAQHKTMNRKGQHSFQFLCWKTEDAGRRYSIRIDLAHQMITFTDEWANTGCS
jgi:hypothetical protein